MNFLVRCNFVQLYLLPNRYEYPGRHRNDWFDGGRYETYVPLPTSVKLLSNETTAFLKSLYLYRIIWLEPRTNFLLPRQLAVFTLRTGRPYIFVRYSLISCFVIRGKTRKTARAGCLAVAFLADTMSMGMLGIHIRNCLETLANIVWFSFLYYKIYKYLLLIC